MVDSHDNALVLLNEFQTRFEGEGALLELTLRDHAMDVEGYVVVWNTAICKGGPFDRGAMQPGMGKGGTRMTADLKLDDIRRLARAMALKNAAAGLKMGGAKSGLRCQLNDPLYEAKYRRFVQLVKQAGILFEDGGMFGGFGYDVGNRPPLNAQWACDELQSLGSFTGKPLALGGTNYENEGIAGLGVAIAAKTILECHGRTVKDTRFAVQGSGAMGAAVIYYFHAQGAQLKFVSDPKFGGTWVLENGASDDLVNALYHQKNETAQSLLNAEGALLSNDTSQSLYQDVDIVFPCAMEDAITEANASKIRAPYVVEGANNPVTHRAYEILDDNGIYTVPGLLANAGGIIAAYVELTADVSLEDNIKNHTKTKLAKDTTIERIGNNIREMDNILKVNQGMRSDQAALYMTYRNLYAGK